MASEVNEALFGQEGGVALGKFTGVAGELAGGGLDAVSGREGDELLMEEMAVGAHAIEFKVGAVHGGRVANIFAPLLLLLARSRRHSFLRRMLNTLIFTTGVTIYPAFPKPKRIFL